MNFHSTFHTSNKGCESMAVITENELRRRLKGKDFKDFKEFKVQKGEIITPSARSFLTEHNVELIYVDSLEDSSIEIEVNKVNKRDSGLKSTEKDIGYKYKTIFGAELLEKPEHMTQLYGNLLVFKDHKRIILRGKMDSLESKILEIQILCSKLGLSKLIDDLGEVLDFVRKIVRCEVLEEPIGDFSLQNMTPSELREKSHHPQKYFGVGHFIPDYSMGEAVIALNSCRTLIRETELLAYEAFKGQYGEVMREDIITALNRLSSLFWIMMFKYRTGKYDKEEKKNG